METLIALLNTDAAVAVIAAVVVLIISKASSNSKRVTAFMAKYRGAVIKAVKLAEKEIPDNVANKGLQRLDIALRYAIRVIETAENRVLNDAEKVVIECAIEEVHNDVIDTAGPEIV